MNKRQRKKARKKKGPAIMAYYWRDDNSYKITIDRSNGPDWTTSLVTTNANDWYLLPDG
jgi:hypothetical protein